jgi:hypothetical protein
MSLPQQFSSPALTTLDGLLGEALRASRSAHLGEFIRDEDSPPIALFRADHVCRNHEGDWYGEHAGKWLCAAALAVRRTADPTLTASLRRVADYLVNRQDSDGYLGTYAPARRFMCRQPAAPRTWDGAPAQRTWDLWVHSYLILGLLEANRALSQPAYTDAARKIGDLCWRALTEGGIDITTLGNHHGLSATVLLDPSVELYFATSDKKYLDLAELILRQANDSPALAFLPQALQGMDAAFIGTGKAYQLCWMLAGLAKLHRATGNADYLRAVQLQWESIHAHHLTLGGGPWGGVGHRSREVFNAPGFFSPHGLVETCSTFAWIQLNRELLIITGEAKYADAIERSAYNDLLGAQAPDGSNWCYYSYPNGRRVFTTYWRCCKSSGPWALEELPALACGATRDGGVAVNLYGPGHTTLSTTNAGLVRLEQKTRYPLDCAIEITVNPERAARFPLRLRIPSWAEHATIRLNGAPGPAATPDTYAVLEREWHAGDVIALDFPMAPRLHRRTHRNVQESRAPDGSPVAQEVLRHDYVAITRGPLVYSTGLIDGYKTEETIRLPRGDGRAGLSDSAPLAGSSAPTVRLAPVGRAPLVFVPYIEAGGRADGTWRLTWLSLAPS